MSSYSEDGFTVSAWGDATGADPVLTDSSGGPTRPGQEPKAFIQWKGTDVCLDLHCPCGAHSHFDGGFAYALECAACGRIFDMPHTVGLHERDR